MKFLLSFLLAFALIGAVQSSVERWGTITNIIKKMKYSLHEKDLVFGEFPRAKFSSSSSSLPSPRSGSSGGLPIVLVHGMGDSCFNEGMQQITNLTGQHFNRYSVCIPGANNWIDDTLSSFLINMNANVDHFAASVAADPQLSNGFYAIGLSQGNSVIRGYLERYNSPTAVKVLHVHGTLEGVSAFPRCPDSSQFCALFAELLGDLAYNPLMQSVLFQADYFRDPLLVTSTAYQQNSQIAAWNGENGASFNASFKTNFLKTQSLTMVKALADTMIDPKESEWWGSYAAGGFTTVLTMEETDWYKQDTFGLRTLHEQGRLSFNTSAGNHLQFTREELFAWADQAGFSS